MSLNFYNIAGRSDHKLKRGIAITGEQGVTVKRSVSFENHDNPGKALPAQIRKFKRLLTTVIDKNLYGNSLSGLRGVRPLSFYKLFPAGSAERGKGRLATATSPGVAEDLASIL